MAAQGILTVESDAGIDPLNDCHVTMVASGPYQVSFATSPCWFGHAVYAGQPGNGRVIYDTADGVIADLIGDPWQ